MNTPDWSRIRGFNYQPSYAAHGLDIWGPAFSLDTIRTELGRGKRHFPGINTIRLWLSHDVYLRDPASLPEKIHRVIELADEFGIRFIPMLFNGWHSWPDFGGISIEILNNSKDEGRFDDVFGSFIDSVVKPHAEDPRILLWDLCNEPFNNAWCDRSRALVLEWLRLVRQRCLVCGARAPITVGSVGNLESVRLLEPVSDVITFHPYFAPAWVRTAADFAGTVDEIQAFARAADKPLLATETGWGSMDDRRRAQSLAVELETLSTRGIGFTPHLLHHTLVADGHRPTHGLTTHAGYMAFVEQDGSRRAYHEVFNEY